MPHLQEVERLEALATQIRSCVQCPLHATRTKAVPGEGAPSARVMLIGEAPGRDEDQRGHHQDDVVEPGGLVTGLRDGGAGAGGEQERRAHGEADQPSSLRVPAAFERQAASGLLHSRVSGISAREAGRGRDSNVGPWAT